MYRIYTADMNEHGITEILNRHFDGFTILPAKGCWHGACEDSIVIEVTGTNRKTVNRAAEEIKELNSQEAVLVTEVPDIPALV